MSDLKVLVYRIRHSEDVDFHVKYVEINKYLSIYYLHASQYRQALLPIVVL